MNLKASLLGHVFTLRGYGSGCSRETIKPLKNISQYSVQKDIKERILLWKTLRFYWHIRLSVPLPLSLPVKSKAGISDWRAVRFVEKLRRPPGTRNYTQRMSRAISSTWLSLWLSCPTTHFTQATHTIFFFFFDVSKTKSFTGEGEDVMSFLNFMPFLFQRINISFTNISERSFRLPKGIGLLSHLNNMNVSFCKFAVTPTNSHLYWK